MAHRFRLPLALLTLAALAAPASAQLSLAPRVGTLGLGVDVGLGLAPVVTARAGVGFIPVEPRGTFDGVDYQVSIPGAVTMGLDLHPGGSGFRLSGGVMIQAGDLSFEGTPAEAVEIGDETYTPEEVGTVHGEVSSADVAPFVTLGFGKHGQPGIGLFLDLGVAFLGDPAVSLSGDGGLAGDPDLEDDFRAEAERVQEDIEVYGRFYPIVNLGLRIGLGG